MAPEEEEVALVVEGGDLAAAELGERGEEGLEEAADGVAEARGEAGEDELGVVWCGAAVALNVSGWVSTGGGGVGRERGREGRLTNISRVSWMDVSLK